MSENIREVIEGFTKDRKNLVSILHKVEDAEKCLTPEAITEISRYLNISENDAYSVASFYTKLRLTNPGGGDWRKRLPRNINGDG